MINSTCLWDNKDSMKTVKITLNDLAVSIDSGDYDHYICNCCEEELRPICQLFNELYELEIYK